MFGLLKYRAEVNKIVMQRYIFTFLILIALFEAPMLMAQDLPQKNGLVTVTGKVYNAKTKEPMSAEIIFTSKADGAQTSTGIHPDGSFKIQFPSNSSYTYIVKAKGFMDFNDKLLLPGEGEVSKEIYLQPIEVGQTVTMRSIIFMQGKYELLPESYPELDRLVHIMNENPSMEIELSGHTDNQGNPKKNIELSLSRVKVVKDYIVSKGIKESRIKGKGYGGSKPVAGNTDPETRKLNRRVEFTVLKR
jgi:outer membrane protein OmpA-like peptidoglycan-associated protein